MAPSWLRILLVTIGTRHDADYEFVVKMPQSIEFAWIA
jgi:hypothetical protein